MPEQFYKILGPDRASCHGGSGRWPAPGTEYRVDGTLVPCAHGLHLCRVMDLSRWLKLDATVWVASVLPGQRIYQQDKIVVSVAELIEPVGVLTREILVTFALDCAEHVLPIFGRRRPGDNRPRVCIETTRKYLRGEATIEELRKARAAAYAAYAAYADAAAYAAAAYAAAAAAYAAAADAAAADAAAERQWQGERLLSLLSESPNNGG